MRALLSLLALALSLAAPARAAVVSLETDATTLTVGDGFDVRLTFEAEGSEFLLAFLVDLFWEGAVIETVAFTDALGPLDFDPADGNAFVNDFGSFAQLFAVSLESDETLAASQPRAFTLVTLRLTATRAGLLTVTLGTLREFSGAAFGALDVTVATESVSVAIAEAVAPVPAPPALALLGTGLALAWRQLAPQRDRQRGVRTSASVS